jgi:hypothetical protein
MPTITSQHVSFHDQPLLGELIHGLLCIGTAPATIVKAPLAMPDDPIPAIARPTMSILDGVATPHIKEPSSKTAKKPRNTHYTESADHLNEQMDELPWR